MHSRNFCFILLIITFKFKLICTTYKFLDLADMEQLIESEYELIRHIEEYIEDNEKKLNTLKLKVLELKNDNDKAFKSDTTRYFLNPINKFSFTRRLTTDWVEIEQYIIDEIFLNKIISFKEFFKFPSKDVFESSVNSLFWLQDIYNLSTTSLVKGEINGFNYDTILTVKDCFELGIEAFKKMDYYHSILWLNETLNNLPVDDSNSDIKYIILEVLIESYFQIGDVKNAVDIGNEISKFSNYQLTERLEKFYNSKIVENIQYNNNILNEFPGHLYKDFLSKNVGSNFAELCRNNNQNQNIKNTNYLNCYYENNNIPFLLIAPFKKEILNIDPLLAIFHDVIYDEEIKSCKDFAKDDLQYTMVYDGQNKKSKLTNHRLSKHKWISNSKKSKIVQKIEKRAGDITTLNIKYSDDFNINNYEIGGYYTPHLDYFGDKGYLYGHLNDKGNRISTLIFYMNDVEQGGATVFTHFNISVIPKKGSALFWYNLHSSGENDPRTRHGACPVLVGSKWIATIWTYEKHQDIHRPCIETSRIKT